MRDQVDTNFKTSGAAMGDQCISNEYCCGRNISISIENAFEMLYKHSNRIVYFQIMIKQKCISTQFALEFRQKLLSNLVFRCLIFIIILSGRSLFTFCLIMFCRVALKSM